MPAESSSFMASSICSRVGFFMVDVGGLPRLWRGGCLSDGGIVGELAVRFSCAPRHRDDARVVRYAAVARILGVDCQLSGLVSRADGRGAVVRLVCQHLLLGDAAGFCERGGRGDGVVLADDVVGGVDRHGGVFGEFLWSPWLVLGLAIRR